MAVRAELGLDGNAAFALLGEDIQSGEAEFVTVNDPYNANEVGLAAALALEHLRFRLKRPEISYFLGRSHPRFCP
jgi:hypothetical protein